MSAPEAGAQPQVRRLPSRMTVMGLGLKPSPPGQSVLYSAADKTGGLAQISASGGHRWICDITGVAGGAQFTRVPPSSSEGAATGSSGHAHADLQAAGDSSISAGVGVQEAVTDPCI